jgi:hypothetical protein
MPTNPVSPVSLKARPQGAPIRTSDKNLWECRNRFSLTCNHGDEVDVPCGRWRTCPGCGRRKSWELRQRFLAGVEQVPHGLHANFFTLTFPLAEAPTEPEAHRALRSLSRRLRYREYLHALGWVLHRQQNGTLHYHGIAWMPWFDDDLAEWRELIAASGFGQQNKLLPAQPEHAGYCARYISTKLAELAPMRRAYSFSRDFPVSTYAKKQAEIAEAGALIGMRPACEWVPTYTLH